MNFIKEQEARESLSKLTGIKVPIPSDLPMKNILLSEYKMIAIVIRLLLAGAEFMPEMYLRETGFTYSAHGPLTKTKKEWKNLKN